MFRSVFILISLAAAAYAAPPNLMPVPAQWSAGSGGLAIGSGFRAEAAGYSDARLEHAIARLVARVSRQTGIAFTGGAGGRPALTVACRERGPELPALGEDEAYQLDVAADGARLQAATVAGALRGMATFAQLIAPGAEGFQAAAVHIDDRPRFPWRGLMLDVSRHWMPAEVVERNLEAMAAVKLNVFHWHLSDDQGFRVESVRHPRLTQFGSDGNFYTQAQVRRVVEYARERGIRVVPEFDMPGHATSWLAGYPELASAPGPFRIERAWGIFQPTLDPTREETYAFLDDFIGEMAALFPDRYFHIGGDEVEDTEWKQSAAIQAFAREHNLPGSGELHAYFNRRLEELLKKHGKTMIGWDEVLAPGLAPGTIIQSWRGQASLADAARKGYRGILSFGYYLDYLKPASFHYAMDPLDGAARELDGAETARILGGEACLWSEYVSAETVDSRIWPRLAAIAERLWSPREVTDVDSMYARMAAVSRLLDFAGVRHRANYAPMLERLAGGRPAEPVRILADATEALGIEGRRDARKYTSLVDLNRFVDAARPESESIRALERAVHRVVAAPEAASAEMAELCVTLRAWAENDARLEPLAEGNGLLGELRPLSRRLAALGAMGLRAVEYLESGKAAPARWLEQQNQALAAMETPSAEVTLAAVRPVRLLLAALSRRAPQTGGAQALEKRR